MTFTSKSIRPFIGAKDYSQSRQFYRDLGFEEITLGDKMCLFKVNENLGFYLQDYYLQDWIDNSMIFVEVEDVEKCAEELMSKGLQHKYDNVRFTGIKDYDWGREVFMHDPSGVLWHFGEFNK